MPKVKRIGENEIYTVYGTRITTKGETEFFLFFDDFWFWEDAQVFHPVSE